MPGEDFEVEESRSITRFVVEPPIVGRFGRIELSIVDFGEGGLQAAHVEPIRLGTRGMVEITAPRHRTPIRARCTVVWSHLFARPNSEGKFHYRTGFRIEEDIEASQDVVRRLLESVFARPDVDSLRRKRAKLDGKRSQGETERRIRVVKRQPREIAPDILLLVQHARSHLRANPEEAKKWYSRARFSLPASASTFQHREETLAIWEFLERSVEIEDIAWVIAHA